MYGSNKVHKQDLSSPQYLWVQDVFPTIQGEGPNAGRPAIFIRMAGCNLRCRFCDTDFESSSWRPSLVDLFAAVEKAAEDVRASLIVITGGEPLRQDISLFVKEWLKNYIVQIETAGTLWASQFDDMNATYVVSPKTPKIHSAFKHKANAWKYIIEAGYTSNEDGLPISNTQIATDLRESKIARPLNATPVYIQPCDTHITEANEQNLKETVRVAMKFGYYISLQQHKIIGVE